MKGMLDRERDVRAHLPSADRVLSATPTEPQASPPSVTPALRGDDAPTPTALTHMLRSIARIEDDRLTVRLNQAADMITALAARDMGWRLQCEEAKADNDVMWAALVEIAEDGGLGHFGLIARAAIEKVQGEPLK
jgi:hypothetical protein